MNTTIKKKTLASFFKQIVYKKKTFQPLAKRIKNLFLRYFRREAYDILELT